MGKRKEGKEGRRGGKEGREGGKAKVEYNVKDHLKIRMFVFLHPQPSVLILGPRPLGPQNIARMNKAYYLFKILLIQH